MIPPDTGSTEPTDEEIALQAYRMWLQEGSPHGHDREHWLKARAELIEKKEKEQAVGAEGG